MIRKVIGGATQKGGAMKEGGATKKGGSREKGGSSKKGVSTGEPCRPGCVRSWRARAERSAAGIAAG